MIYIDRDNLETPNIFFSKETEIEFEKMKSFFQNKSMRKQVRYNFRNKIYSNREVKSSLNQLFNNKCAYCESLVSNVAVIDVDHFRPKRNAMSLDGNVDRDNYWWLAYDWKNLYASCPNCNRSKMTRFPVQSKRLKFGDEIQLEKPLLIDPCNEEDFITNHLEFRADGTVIGVTEKGEVTISVLNLNRKPLVESRKNSLNELKIVLERITLKNKRKLNFGLNFEMDSELMKLLSAQSEYLSAKRSYLNRYIGGNKYIDIKDINKSLVESLGINKSIIDNINFNEEASSFLKRETISNFDKNIKKTSLNEDAVDDYFTKAKIIERIEISNFKIIESLDLVFPKNNLTNTPWMVLLGENGSGKSSVLQAVALALMGSEKANKLGLNPAKLVNRNTRKRTGYIKVYLEGIKNPFEIVLSKDSSEFSSLNKSPNIAIVTFGSTRLMSRDSVKDDLTGLENVRNLFDPYTQLQDVEGWLADPNLVETKLFDEIAIELKKVLLLPEDKLIYRRKTKTGKQNLFLKTNSTQKGLELRELSAGYQAVFVLVLSVIREVLKTWKHYKVAEGIVLIDEIGVHLHPRWKMQIVNTLREIFPAMTFIVTTHAPLCLRGLEKGEITLMKFDENGKVMAIDDLPSPKNLTIEQLITSNLFGLISSFDPEIEIKLNSYYRLRAKSKLTDSEETELNKLSVELEEMNQIGELSKMDQMNFAVDEIISKKKYLNSSIDTKNIKADLKNTIGDIWKKRNKN